MKNTAFIWLAFGLASFLVLPWHVTDMGVLSGAWINDGAVSTGLNTARVGHW